MLSVLADSWVVHGCTRHTPLGLTGPRGAHARPCCGATSTHVCKQGLLVDAKRHGSVQELDRAQVRAAAKARQAAVAEASYERDVFEAHFSSVYGPRWRDLWAALRSPSTQAAWANTLRPRPVQHSESASAFDPVRRCESLGLARVHPSLPCFLCPTDGTVLNVRLDVAPPRAARSVDAPADTSTAPASATQAVLHRQTTPPPQGIDSTLLRATPPRAGEPHSAASEGESHAAYFLDCASVLPPLFLEPRPGDRVLDLCAAPGGKSLVLAWLLFKAGHGQPNDAHAEHQHAAGGAAMQTEHTSTPPAQPTVQPPTRESSLTCNDWSGVRRARLHAVLHAHLPESLLGGAVRVSGFNGAAAPQSLLGTFDCVLVDAPCSSERHLAQRSGQGRAVAKDDWSPSRSVRNARTQLALLQSAVRLCRPGGRLVYSTCSIAPTENDQVVAKLLKKARGSVECMTGTVEVDATAALHVERTQLGRMLLPDTSGFGPMYWSVLRVI